MLSANQIKYFKSLHAKKNRDAEGVFIAEGDKLLKDLIDSDFECFYLFQIDVNMDNSVKVSEKEMSRISGLKNYSNSFGVFRKKEWQIDKGASKVLCLDGIQDPGNFGTIIRLMDWFGIRQLICSTDTVDVYNPKVIQSTMGSLRNVSIVYGDLKTMIQSNFGNHLKLGTFMNGINVQSVEFPENIVLIMGNEGKGIRKELIDILEKKISIPSHPSSKAESLNVAISTAIILHSM